MGKRGQILADELLANCKRYIRFRETGSPDAVEAEPKRTWRFVEAKDVDDFKMGTKLGGALYDETGAKMSVIGTRDAERIAALLSPPPAGRAGEREQALEKANRMCVEMCSHGKTVPHDPGIGYRPMAQIECVDCVANALLAARTPTP